MEPRPTARRFEVYGSRGSAILEPFEPAGPIRLCLAEPAGAQSVPGAHADPPGAITELELRAFVATLRGQQPPDRPPDHELLVQETLLRLTGRIAA